MSKRYKNRLTVTGEKTGRRVRWLALAGGRAMPSGKLDAHGKQIPGVKLNHIFVVLRINDSGAFEYMGWTGQIGICKVKGQQRHALPNNQVIHADPHRIMVYSMFVPFGTEDEVGKGYVELMQSRATGPLMNWFPPAGTERGKLKLAALDPTIAAVVSDAVTNSAE